MDKIDGFLGNFKCYCGFFFDYYIVGLLCDVSNCLSKFSYYNLNIFLLFWEVII